MISRRRSTKNINCEDMDVDGGHEQVNSLRGAMKRKRKSSKREFIGWSSKILIEFLASIGEDITKKLSEHDVTSIIIRYVNKNNLLHPQKRRKVLCDERLRPLLRRKSIKIYQISNIVESHLAENLETSEEDETSSNSKDIDDNGLLKHERSIGGKSKINQLVSSIPQSHFAAIVPDNIKLVYLKRSLVLELLKCLDTFESKMNGSFVKVKSDSYRYSQHQTCQLFQVIGIKKNFETRDANSEIVLQAPYAKDIPINMLADVDLTEGECEDYLQKVNNRIFKRPTIGELEQKAKSLHYDITKHRIEKELSELQSLIDRANEKGWKREVFDYIERKHLLMSPEEQLRLFNEVPKVIPDMQPLKNAAEGSSEISNKDVEVAKEKHHLLRGSGSSKQLEGSGNSTLIVRPRDASQERMIIEDENELWQCMGPLGERIGPFPLPNLMYCCILHPHILKCKVWKIGQSEEQGILLYDFIDTFSELCSVNLWDILL